MDKLARIQKQMKSGGRFAAFLGLLVLSLLGVSVAQAQDVGVRHTDPTWQAQYWNNPNLSGDPVLTREETSLNFDWGYGSPDAAVNADYFSARWTRYIDVEPGTYRFTATTDDGIRIFVDGQKVIDAWFQQAPTTYTGTINLGPGHHLVVVEYFELTQRAVAQVSYQLVSGTAPTPTPTPDPGTGPWRASFFNNTSLSGSPVVTRQVSDVNFDWGLNAPLPSVRADNFSARFFRQVDLPAGNYRFRVTVDDGVRLFVNGHTLIDAWFQQAPTTYTGDIFLPGGPVDVQLEYFEAQERALVQLSWERIGQGAPTPTPTPPTITAWRGEYWNNTSLSGAPALVRDVQNVDFQWGDGSPAPGVVGTDRFSARWTRNLDLSAGYYRFVMTVDDGGRLYLNNQLVLNAWRDQAPTTYETTFYHHGGSLPVKMEYYESTGFAVARLFWDRVSGPAPTPTPPTYGTVIVDETDPGFVRGGSSSGWAEAYEGYNGHLFWTQNNYRVQSGYNWGRWYPDLQTGRYEVFVYIPDRYTTTSNARYWISHAGGYTLRTVNQSAVTGGQWVSLGTYSFRGTDQDYVSLADVTYEPYLSRLLAWDAVKWEPR